MKAPYFEQLRSLHTVCWTLSLYHIRVQNKYGLLYLPDDKYLLLSLPDDEYRLLSLPDDEY